MKKLKKQYRIIIVAIIVGINIVETVYFFNKHEQNIRTKELNQLISSFEVDDNNNKKEISDMKDFKIKNPDLDRKNTSIYYLNLTKLYILDLFDWENMDKAVDNFIRTQIEAEVAKEWDVAAWSYADISQIYIDFYTYDIAESCIQKALDYSKRCKMEDFFYEYCYTTLSMIYSTRECSDLAMEYYYKSLEYNSEERKEYESMD